MPQVSRWVMEIAADALRNPWRLEELATILVGYAKPTITHAEYMRRKLMIAHRLKKVTLPRLAVGRMEDEFDAFVAKVIEEYYL